MKKLLSRMVPMVCIVALVSLTVAPFQNAYADDYVSKIEVWISVITCDNGVTYHYVTKYKKHYNRHYDDDDDHKHPPPQIIPYFFNISCYDSECERCS